MEIRRTTIANLIEWLRGFDQNALVLDHGLFVVEDDKTYEFPGPVAHPEREES